MTPARRAKTGLSIGSRTDTSLRDPRRREMSAALLGCPQTLRLTLDLLDASSDPTEGDAGVLGEDEVDLAVGTETDLEQRLDVIRNHFRLGTREHAQNDDGASSLELGDGLVRTCGAEGAGSSAERARDESSGTTHCTPATAW